MRDVSRRDAMTMAAGLAICAQTVSAGDAAAQGGPTPADEVLEKAHRSPQSFMFAEQVTTKLAEDGAGRDLVITSAASNTRVTHVYLRPRSVRIFRAAAGVDEFTRKGGVYW